MQILYSRKLSRGKNFVDSKEVTISWRKLLRNTKTYHRWVWHAQILWRKLLMVALKPRNSRMFSPSKVFRYRVFCQWYRRPHCVMICETYLWDVLPLWQAVQVTEYGHTDRLSLLGSALPCLALSDWLPASRVGGRLLRGWGLLLCGVLPPLYRDLCVCVNIMLFPCL